jgi:hypothetical protein
MSEATSPTTTEEAEPSALAERAGLEHREADAVAVDPRALSIFPADECRRPRAVPLAATTGTVIALQWKRGGAGRPGFERQRRECSHEV